MCLVFNIKVSIGKRGSCFNVISLVLYTCSLISLGAHRPFCTNHMHCWLVFSNFFPFSFATILYVLDLPEGSGDSAQNSGHDPNRIKSKIWYQNWRYTKCRRDSNHAYIYICQKLLPNGKDIYTGSIFMLMIN